MFWGNIFYLFQNSRILELVPEDYLGKMEIRLHSSSQRRNGQGNWENKLNSHSFQLLVDWKSLKLIFSV